MENARRENRELENKSANPPKLELSIIGTPRLPRTDGPYGRTVRTVRTDGPYGRFNKHNDALNYPGIFMLVIGTGGVRVNPKFSN